MRAILISMTLMGATASASAFAIDHQTVLISDTKARAWARYQNYLRAFEQSASRTEINFSRLRTEEGRRFFETSGCFVTYADPQDPQTFEILTPADGALNADIERELLSIAEYYASVRATLRYQGYSIRRYEPVVRVAERQHFDYRMGFLIRGNYAGEPVDHMENFSDRMEAIRRRYDPGLPEFRSFEECGGEDSLVRFSSLPDGAEIWIITQFRFSFCQVTNVDPWDRSRCRYWISVSTGATIYVAGRFVYFARWQTGDTTSGRGLIPPSSNLPTINYQIRRGQPR